jgi:hypothetical protein
MDLDSIVGAYLEYKMVGAVGKSVKECKQLHAIFLNLRLINKSF